jgi:pimeloyl-ACP methyl ester carboxylesterase
LSASQKSLQTAVIKKSPIKNIAAQTPKTGAESHQRTAPFFPQGVVEGVEECWMDFDGARMRYLRAGSGPAMILLHGLMGYSFSWRYAMPALAPYRTVYALDMLGAGFSDRPRIDHSMRATALRLLQFAQNLGIASLDLLGTSRGGAVAMCAAAEAQDRGQPHLRSLILVAPVNPYSSHGRHMAAMAGTPWGSAVVRSVLNGIPSLYPYWHGRMFGDASKIPPGSLEGYTAPLAIPGLFDHALSIVSTWGQDLRELEALLPKLANIPTLLVWGSADPAVYASSMQPLARHFQNVETVVFPGVGHLPYEECPEEFNRALVSFLKTETRG